MIVVPNYIAEGVEKWLDDFDKKLDTPMTIKDREYNRQSMIEYGLKHNKLPPIEETFKRLNDAKQEKSE